MGGGTHRNIGDPGGILTGGDNPVHASLHSRRPRLPTRANEAAKPCCCIGPPPMLPGGGAIGDRGGGCNSGVLGGGAHTHTHTHTLENNTLTIIDIGRSPRIVFQDKEELTAKAPRFFIVCSTKTVHKICHARGMRTRKQPSRNLDPKQAVLPQKSQNSAFHVVNRKAETTIWVSGKLFHNLVCTSLSASLPVLGLQTPP